MSRERDCLQDCERKRDDQGSQGSGRIEIRKSSGRERRPMEESERQIEGAREGGSERLCSATARSTVRTGEEGRG